MMSELPRSASVAESGLRARFEGGRMVGCPLAAPTPRGTAPTTVARLSTRAHHVAHNAAHALVAQPSSGSRWQA